MEELVGVGMLSIYWGATKLFIEEIAPKLYWRYKEWKYKI